MIAEAYSALADADSGFGVSLYMEDEGGPVNAVVAPIPFVEFEGRISASVAAAALVSVARDEFEGQVPTSGSFKDRLSGFTYRILSVEDMPQRPHVEFTCEASKSV